MLHFYPSVESALRTVYPEHDWKSSGFIQEGRSPSGFWKDGNNVKCALDMAEGKLGIKEVRCRIDLLWEFKLIISRGIGTLLLSKIW